MNGIRVTMMSETKTDEDVQRLRDRLTAVASDLGFEMRVEGWFHGDKQLLHRLDSDHAGEVVGVPHAGAYERGRSSCFDEEDALMRG